MKTIKIRLDVDECKKLTELAKRERRSVNQQLERDEGEIITGTICKKRKKIAP